MKKLFIVALMLGVMFASSAPPQAAIAACNPATDVNCTYCDPASPVRSENCITPSAETCTPDNCNLVEKYLNPFISVMTIMVGIAVVIGVILGGIQYAGSAGDPQKVTVAKRRIRNSIVALIIFIFLYALLNFLIPGGLLAR